MKRCFSHFVNGKIIREGIDQSGFVITAKSKNLQDSVIQEILPQISIGQILNWEKFVETFALTQDSVKGYCALAYTFKSREVDSKRGYFQVQHCLLIEDGIPENFVKLAIEFASISANYNYAFSEATVVDPLCFEMTDEFDNFYWDFFNANKNIVLHIIDRLFYSKSIFVVTNNADPVFRLKIANAVWLLLPPVLRKQLSFHTHFFSSPEKIRSLLKFTDSPNLIPSNQTVLDTRRGDDALSAYDIRSEYVKYLFHVLSTGTLSPKDLSLKCATLVTEDGQFTISYSKVISDSLQDLIEIPIILSKIEYRSPDLTIEEVLNFLQKRQVFTSQERLKIVWGYLCKSQDKEAISRFIVSHLEFAENVLIGNVHLTLKWLHHLVDIKDKKSLDSLLNSSEFLSKYTDFIPLMLSVFVLTDEEFDQKRMEFLLDNALKSDNPKQFIEIVLAGGIGFAKHKFPFTFNFLELVSEQNLKSRKLTDLFETLSQEVGIDNFIRLSILGLQTGHLDLLTAETFQLLPRSPLSSSFFYEIEKNVDKIINSSINLYGLGALCGSSVIYAPGILKKIVPVNSLNENLKNIIEYAEGFVNIADASKSILPKDVYTRYTGSLGSLYDLLPLNRTYLYTVLAELTSNYESGKYLLNQATQSFNYHTQNSGWTGLGEKLLKLYSTKYSGISDAFTHSMIVAYIKTLGNLEPKSAHSIVIKLLDYSISPKAIIDALIRAISSGSYTVQQKLDILFHLAINCYPSNGIQREVGRHALLRILESSYIVNISQKQFDDIEDLVKDDSSLRLVVRDERWKRAIKKSLVEFISLVLDESRDRQNAEEIDQIIVSITKVWHPQNGNEVRTVLTHFKQENKVLWEKLLFALFSGKIDTGFDVRIELTNDELIGLEREVKRVENMVVWLSQGRIDSTASRALVKQMLSNLSSLDKALEQLRSRLKPSIWARITTWLQR